MKFSYTIFFVLISFLFPFQVSATLGDITNPAESCKAILDADPSANSGEYYLQSSSMSSPRQMYCNMDDAGGGWTLLFQRRGGAGNLNTESCGTHLNNFLQNPCGSTTNLAYGDSYSSDVDLTLGQFEFNEFLIIQENSAGVQDNDDNFIIQTTHNIFPDFDSGQNNFDIISVCNIAKSNCETSNPKWIYTGTSWFGSALCKASNYAGSTSYKGNYGYCHNGFDDLGANRFLGNRHQYSETKLWGHNNGAKAYMERVYIKKSNIAPRDFILSNNTIPSGSLIGTQVGDLSATDDDGDTLEYNFSSGTGDDDNGSFLLSGSSLVSAIVPNADIKRTYSVRLEVSDGVNLPVEKVFIIHITGGTFLGSVNNPAPSCLAIKNAHPSFETGLYYLQSASMPTYQLMHCEMQRNGGGWILAFQRAGGTRNVESCGDDLNDFIQNTCGDIYSLEYQNSYSADIGEVYTHFSPDEFMDVQFSSNMTPDTDDAFIVRSGVNIFPDSTGLVENIPIQAVCDVNGSGCDTTDVYWKYVGDSFFSGARCSSGYASRTSYNPPLEGDFGYCHNGLGSYSANSLFGNRSAYNEVKLWYYPPGEQFMERVYVRKAFTDIISPTISSYSPGSGALIPSTSVSLEYTYHDYESGINIGSGSLAIKKFSSGVWGSDIAQSIITQSQVTGLGAQYDVVFPSFGKYQILFQIADYAGNISTIEHIVYIDQVEFIVGSEAIDIGTLSPHQSSQSPEYIITVKTLGAGFNVTLKRDSDLSYSLDTIYPWDSSKGYGYILEPYSGPIHAPLHTPQVIFSQGRSINQNGERNEYTFKLKFEALIENDLIAGDYEGLVDFGIVLDY